MSQWVKILNVGNNVCSPSQGQPCFKILNLGTNICATNPTNCIKINDVRIFDELIIPTTWDIDIEIFEPNQSFSIELVGNDFPSNSISLTIDWGDGLPPQIFTTKGTKTKNYTAAGLYTIKISGKVSNNIFQNDYGNIKIITDGLFKSTSSIPLITGLTDMRFSFYYLPNSFNFIPENLFAFNPAITNFLNTFSKCSNIVNIPSGLFRNNLQANRFSSCFSETSITSIPENLFANNIQATNFDVCFFDCPFLNSIPENLFSNNTGVINFDNCFAYTNITSVPPTLFANNTKVLNFTNCFGGLTLTTESYSNLLINMASNASSRENNVPFGGGNSRYNLAGQAAKQTLEAKGWIFNDGGLAS